jgi:glutamate-5-semialdehyde dehydrogenase
MSTVIDQAKAARAAAIRLATVSEDVRNQALEAMADGIAAASERLIEANRADVADAEKLKEAGELAPELVKRLILNDKKLEGVIASIRSVIALPDPVGHTLDATEISPGLELYKVSVPIGVLGIVFESRPDVVAQVASLCVKSGNAVLMKGGREATRTNRALARVIVQSAARVDGVPEGWLHLLETREEVSEILKLDQYVDLLIPRGGNAFVQHVMNNTNIPVLGHADGVCHVYVDADASAPMAVGVAFDAKTQYVAVCNAMETLLVHEAIADTFLRAAAEPFQEAGVTLRLDERSARILADYPLAEPAEESDWSAEYLDTKLAVKVVDSLQEAIEHINTFGSHHTDSIVTDNDDAARAFLAGVDSASVMHNASTRFADGFRYGLGAEIGIGTGRIHSRGPVGLEGLVIYKYIVKGAGHTVASHTDGGGKVEYTHKPLDRTL